VLDLVDAIRQLEPGAADGFEPVFEPARLGEIERSVLDPTHGEEGLGWTPKLTLENGLRATWQWED
jgi:UDP-glucose 4-epimerase